MEKISFNRIIAWFFRGLLFVIPASLTIYFMIVGIQWIDGLLGISIPGIGLLLILVAITSVGYLASLFITRPIFEYLEKGIEKLPMVNLIYTSLKDLIGAFVGDKKKFNKPVAVQLDGEGAVFKLGFVTQTDLDAIGMKDFVSVYLPHSYNFSGNQFLVLRERIRPISMPSSDAMKFIVSGGVSGLEKE